MTNSRHARQGFLGADSERRIASTRAAIVGLCGGGSHVAQQLAHIGVGGFELVDFDSADFSNLNRMVGLSEAEAESEARKVDVVRERILAVNPSASVNVHECSWSAVQDALKDCAVIFGCVDSFAEREALERFARRYLIPYIDVGMDVHEHRSGYLLAGQVIVSLPGKPCLRCFGLITEERLAQEAGQYGKAGGRPQVVWPNGVLASTAVGKFMQMLLPWSHDSVPVLYTEYDGNRDILRASNLLKVVAGSCPHFQTSNVGDETW
jgi:hypothetical protein